MNESELIAATIFLKVETRERNRRDIEIYVELCLIIMCTYV